MFYAGALGLSLVLLLSCGGGQDSASRTVAPVTVTAGEVHARSASYYDDYPATVRALSEVELRAQVNGYVTGIHFKEGGHVRKGQRLYTIDPQQSNAAYEQAKANLALQEANLEKAKKDLDRYVELDKRDAIAKQQVDYAQAAYATAKQQVEAARAAVQSVQTNVRYTTIEAPFDGTIGISNVRLGSAVTPGQTLLNVISTDNPMAADINVDQSEIYRFEQLQSDAEKARSDSTFALVFGARVYPHGGAISIIDRAVDPMTGSIRMRLIFPNPNNELRVGMSCALRVRTLSSSAIVIPYKAVNEQLGEFFVYLASDGKATQKKIKLGKQVGHDVIILDGLQEGDLVINEGTQNLREGTSIMVSGDKN